MLKEVESPRLLSQFHPKIQDEVIQSLEVQTSQPIHELENSLELVSQGPTLPEPPSYDFQAELDELEEEQEKIFQDSLLKSLIAAQRAQMTGILNLAKQKIPATHTRRNIQKIKVLPRKSNQKIPYTEEIVKEKALNTHESDSKARTKSLSRKDNVKQEKQGFLGALWYIGENSSYVHPETVKILRQFSSKNCIKDIYKILREKNFNLPMIYEKINQITSIERKNIPHKELEKIFHSIEFNIFKDNTVVVQRKFGKKYSLDFVVNSVGSEGGGKLLGIVTRSNSKNNDKIDPVITLFNDVLIGEKNGKGVIKYNDSSTDGITSKYTFWRGQSRIVLECGKDKRVSSHQLINDALSWVKSQPLDNIQRYRLSKLPRDQFLRVESVSPDGSVFDLKKSNYQKATLFLDTKDFPSTAKKICFNYGTEQWEGAKSTSINLGDVIDELLRVERDIRIHSRKIFNKAGNIVKVGDENQKIMLKVGSHYIAHGHDSRSFEIIPRHSKAGLAATIREYLLYRLLKSKYLAEDVIAPKKISKPRIVKELDHLSTKYKVPGEVREANYRCRLRTLKALNLVRMDPNDKILRWMNVSNDIENSYKYWISYLYRVGLKKTRQAYRPCIKSLIEDNLSYTSIQGLDLFNRRKTKRIPIKNWEIVLYNLDDGQIINKLLSHKYRKFDSLPIERKLKQYIKSYISTNPECIEFIRDNNLSKIGYNLSKRYFALHEYQDGKSQHTFLKRLNELYQKKAGKSILGNEFEGYKLHLSEQESTKYIHTLYTSEDMYASNNENDHIRIITKGSTINSNLGAHQLLELTVQKGYKIIIHIDYDPTSDLGSIYVGRLFDSLVAEGLGEKALLFSQFHHEVWKKMRTRANQLGYISLDETILKKIESLVIYNPKNNYSDSIHEYWKEYISELYNYFGRERIAKGIRREAFDSWWKQIIRNLLMLKEKSKHS